MTDLIITPLVVIGAAFVISAVVVGVYLLGCKVIDRHAEKSRQRDRLFRLEQRVDALEEAVRADG